MLKILFLFIFINLIIGCNNTKSKEVASNQEGGIKKDSIVDSDSNEKFEITLSNFFKEETCTKIQELNKGFNDVSSNSDLIDNLYNASKLAKKLTVELETSNTPYLRAIRQKFEYASLTNQILNQVQLSQNELNPIVATEGPEAVSVDFFVNFKKYDRYVGKTSKKDDDEFIKILVKVYGENSLMGFINFTEEWIYRESIETTYLGFGNGKLLETFQVINDFEHKFPSSFSSEIKKIKNQLEKQVYNIWKSDLVCFHQKNDVIIEFENLSKLDKLTPEFKLKLNDHLHWLENQPWTYFGNDPEERQSYDTGE